MTEILIPSPHPSPLGERGGVRGGLLIELGFGI